MSIKIDEVEMSSIMTGQFDSFAKTGTSTCAQAPGRPRPATGSRASRSARKTTREREPESAFTGASMANGPARYSRREIPALLRNA